MEAAGLHREDMDLLSESREQLLVKVPWACTAHSSMQAKLQLRAVEKLCTPLRCIGIAHAVEERLTAQGPCQVHRTDSRVASNKLSDLEPSPIIPSAPGTPVSNPTSHANFPVVHPSRNSTRRAVYKAEWKLQCEPRYLRDLSMAKPNHE